MSIIEEYPYVTLWKKIGFPVGINEKAYISENEYIGKETQNKYPFDQYYHSEQFLAKVKSIDDRNLTGMYHLCEEWSDNSEENAQTLKNSLFGKELIVERAHCAGERPVYRSVYPVHEYWSDLELEIGEKIR